MVQSLISNICERVGGGIDGRRERGGDGGTLE